MICPNCGCATNSQNVIANTAADTGSAGWTVLGFFVPIIGFILYLIWKDTRPNDAKKAGKGALIGFIVTIAFSIIYGAVIGSIIGGSLYY